MAARKLQSEIDRTLKKVSEGVELFESIYDKMQASTNQTQKEKLETDLKTQIKKLQRMRDQIKTWVASNDIKDKTQLLENRRLIETQMEKFKACEKEMKTKAFSKEGLIQASKLDPKAQEKLEATQWLQSQVEELLMQVETAEAEIETLQGGTKKKKGAASTERQDELERLNERRKWHISRLEIVLRLLDNGSLAPEKVNELKEDVQYFIESNTEEGFEEDEGIYDELNLDAEEEKFGLAADDDDSSSESEEESEAIPPRTPSKKHDEESVSSKREEHSPILKKATAVSIQSRRKETTSHVEAPKPPPISNPHFAAPMSSVLKNGIPQASRPPAQLPVRYATAAAAGVSSNSVATHTPTNASTSSASGSASGAPATSAPSATAAPTVVPSPSVASQDLVPVATSSPSLTHPSVSQPSPLLSSASASVPHPEESFHSSSQSPQLSEAPPVGPPLATSSPQQKASVVSARVASPFSSNGKPTLSEPLLGSVPPLNQQQSLTALQAPQPGSSPLPQQVQQLSIAGQSQATSSDSSPLPPHLPQFPPGVKIPGSVEQQSHFQQQLAGTDVPQRLSSPATSLHQAQYPQQRPVASTSTSAFPGALSDLVASFESVKQKAAHRMNNLDQVQKILDTGYAGMPQPQDTEKPKYYVPRNPFQTPMYYPQTVLPVLSSPALFAQLDIETLFYVFYYLPGTYQQYLAAKELKRQSWRFHVKYLTWFQRHAEPQAITEEYEQGVYVYFDWEGSWCQRKKSDFRFEYRYLSED